MLPVNNEKKSNHSWSVWDYGNFLLAAAATVGSAYFGLRYLSSFWQSDGIEVDLTLATPVDSTADGVNPVSFVQLNSAPHLNTGRRKLLAASVVNPVPDIQFEATIEDRYALDGTNIFSGDVAAISVLSSGNAPLPSWLRFDTTVGSYDTPGNANAVVVEGVVAYVADGSSGLQVLDVSNPLLPTLLGNYDTPGEAYAVVVQGAVAYVADGTSGLQVLDVSNPAAITLLATYDTPGEAYGVAVQGSMAYVADWISGLQLLDVSNSANITLVGSYAVPVVAQSVFVKANVAYVTAQSSGLQVLNVSNPANITLLGSYDTSGTAWNVFVQDTTAYVTNIGASLQLLNVSNPANITLLGSYNTLGSPWGIVVQGNTAYVADFTSGLQVLDVSNPAAITLLATYDTPGGAVDVVLLGSTAYVADSNSGSHVLDLSRGELIGTATSVLVGQVYSLEIVAYNTQLPQLAIDSFQLTVNQLPKRQDNSLANHNLFPGASLRLNLDGDALFNDPDNSFLKLSVAISGSSSLPPWLGFSLKPTLLGSYDTPGGVQGVAVQTNTAYGAYWASGLQVLDVSNPVLPTLLGSYDTPGLLANTVVVQGAVAYVTDYTSSLQMLDVSNPAAITFLGSYGVLDWANGVAILGNIAYVADGGVSGLQVLDVSNPSSITLLGSFVTSGQATDVCIQDSAAYVADVSGGLQVLDVSNPAAITLLGSYTTPWANGVFVQDSIAYVADYKLGLYVLDVSNLANITLLGHYVTTTQGTVKNVVVQSNTAFVVGQYGLQALDVGDPSNIILLGNYNTLEAANDVTIIDNTVYVTGGNLQIIDPGQWELTANPISSDVGNYEIVLTATDHLGGTASDTFTIRVEGPPVFNRTLPNQAISVGDAYNYFVPQGIVVDPNDDAVTFSAALSDDSSLPSWLSFNPFSATFVGTPDVSGQYVIKVSATDGIAGSTSTNFNLNVSHKPQIQQPIIDPFPWRGGREFTFVIPNNAFVDLDGNALLYSAQLNNGDALPAWLQFDTTTATFSGTPPVGEITIFDVQVTATDPVTGSSATQNFQLQITENFPPVLENPISTQVATATKSFSFTVPSTTFNDPNQDPLSYSAGGIGGQSLPKWLHFFPESRTFAGKPGRGDTGTYADKVVGVEVTASDGEKSTNTAFNISVKGASHWELAIKVGAPLISGLSLLLACYGGRAYCLNRLNKNKYQKLQQSVGVGEVGALIDLSADPKKIRSVRAKVLKAPPKNCCQKLSRFFRSPRQALPDGDLPYWLNYFPNSNQLAVVNGGPGEADVGEVIIQVKDSAGVTLEQFPLQVVSQRQDDAMTNIGFDTAPDNPVFGEDAVNDEVGGIPMTTFS